MRTIQVLLAITLVILPAGVLAKNDTVKIAPAPAWVQVSELMEVPATARGSLFMRSANVQVHHDKSGQYLYTGFRAKLLDTNALQLGNLAIAWNPASGSPVVHTIRIYRDGVARDALAGAKFEILRRENQLEMAMLDGILTATLRIPDLRVGDELELAYTVPSHDPTLRTSNAGFVFFNQVPPPGRVTLRVSWDEGQEPNLRPTADLAPILRREGRSVSVSYDNGPTLIPPKDAPPRYAIQRLVEFSDYSDWAGVSRQIYPLFQTAAKLGAKSAVRTEASAIAAAHSAPLDRATAALKLVEEQVRYIYVGLNGGNMNPASAEETWQRRYGDCKGKTALLLALLKELGIEAEAVLVNNQGGDDGLDARLPNPAMFDHVLVRARIDGKVYWLDGTLPPVYRPTEELVLPHRWVQPLSATGTALERVPWQPAVKPRKLTLYEIDAREGFTADSKIRVVTVTRGLAALQEYIALSAVPENQLEESVRSELEGTENVTSIDKVTWRFDPVQQASILEFRSTGKVEWDDDGGGAYDLSLPGGGFSPPRRRQRSGTPDPAVPYYIAPDFSCHVTYVRLPKATTKDGWKFNSVFNELMFGETFHRKFDMRAGSVRMVRSTRTLQTELDLAAVTRDNARIGDFDNSMARIMYHPGGYDPPTTAVPVPDIDEIDWVANPEPCLEPPRSGG